eukprot:4555900-Prymnesium_polylepis.1
MTATILLNQTTVRYHSPLALPRQASLGSRPPPPPPALLYAKCDCSCARAGGGHHHAAPHCKCLDTDEAVPRASRTFVRPRGQILNIACCRQRSLSRAR